MLNASMTSYYQLKGKTMDTPTISFNSAPAQVVPSSDAAPVSAPIVPVAVNAPTTDYQPETPVTVPPTFPEMSDFYVSADSISSASSNDINSAMFDIVVNASWTCPTTGQFKTAKIVKTISLDKKTLFTQMLAQPVSIVETKAPVEEKKDNSKLLKKMRELAGIPGRGNFV